MRADRTSRRSAWFLALAGAAVLLQAGTLNAVVYDLNAGPVTVTIPATGESVTMWGFGLGAAAPTVPGPALVVPPGDTTLTINLTNNLPEDVSIVLPGQVKAMAPTFFFDATGRRRVQSFDAVAAATGGTQSYTWTGLKPGSYIYQSGSHPGVQVQMGLYGAAIVRPATAGEAYPGIPYDREVVVVLSEVDTALHSAVAGNTYGDVPGSTMTSPVDFQPRYFLVNGTPYAPGSFIGVDTAGAPLNSGDRILVRFLNAGLRTHVMALFAPTPATAAASVPAPYFTVQAEDGRPYPYPHQLYTVALPAGKTADAVFSPTGPGDYSLQDRVLALTNGVAVGEAGLQAVLRVGGVAGPTGVADAYTTPGNTTPGANTLTVAAPGVLGNDSSAGTKTAVLVTTTTHGTLALAADGSFTYTPAVGFAGIDAFTYRVTDPAPGNVATVTITVQLPPVAANDTYAVVAGATLSVPGPGVLSNDSSPAGLALTAVLGTGPAAGTLTLNANGSFSYQAPATLGPRTFTYTASDGALSSAPATVTLNVTAPQPPVAANESYATTATATAPSLAVAAPGVLGNDSSPAGLPLTAVLVTGPTKLAGGSFTLSADGSFSYWTKNLTATTDSFTYRASDGTLLSAPATVTIAIAAHPAPVANNDTFSAPRRTGTTYTAVVLPILANDTATNATLVVTATGVNPASPAIVGQPSRGGTVSVIRTGPNAGRVSYTPARNFRGSDAFTYSVRDSVGGVSNTGRVTVNVQ